MFVALNDLTIPQLCNGVSHVQSIQRVSSPPYSLCGQAWLVHDTNAPLYQLRGLCPSRAVMGEAGEWGGLLGVCSRQQLALVVHCNTVTASLGTYFQYSL